jgi:hypothetical protein
MPKRFFLELMANMREKGFDQLVVASDDRPWVLDALPAVPSRQIIGVGAERTLAIMASCAAGILSPSTYAWAAALLAGSEHKPELFLAPEFWLGFRQSKWYHYPGIESRTLTYVSWSVPDEERLPPLV